MPNLKIFSLFWVVSYVLSRLFSDENRAKEK